MIVKKILHSSNEPEEAIDNRKFVICNISIALSPILAKIANMFFSSFSHQNHEVVKVVIKKHTMPSLVICSCCLHVPMYPPINHHATFSLKNQNIPPSIRVSPSSPTLYDASLRPPCALITRTVLPAPLPCFLSGVTCTWAGHTTICCSSPSSSPSSATVFLTTSGNSTMRRVAPASSSSSLLLAAPLRSFMETAVKESRLTISPVLGSNSGSGGGSMEYSARWRRMSMDKSTARLMIRRSDSRHCAVCVDVEGGGRAEERVFQMSSTTASASCSRSRWKVGRLERRLRVVARHLCTAAGGPTSCRVLSRDLSFWRCSRSMPKR